MRRPSSTRTSPSTIVSAHVGAACRVDERGVRVDARGARYAGRAGPRIRSARLPASTCRSRRTARAPARLRASPSRPRRAQSGRPVSRRTAWSRAAQPHLVEHVEPVVAGGAVGAERHRDAARAHLGDRRDARSELEVRARAVQHVHAVLGKQPLRRVVHPDAMRRAEPGRARARWRRGTGCCRGRSARGRARSPRATPTRACGRSGRHAAESRGDRFEQPTRARHGEARRERRRGSVRPAAPCHARVQRDALVDRLARGFSQACGHALVARPSCTCRSWRAGRTRRSPRRRRRCRGRSPW